MTIGEKDSNGNLLFKSVSSDGSRIRYHDAIRIVRLSFLTCASTQVRTGYKDGNPFNNSPENLIVASVYIHADPSNLCVPITDPIMLEVVINFITLEKSYSAKGKYEYLMGYHFPQNVDKPRLIIPDGYVKPEPKKEVKNIVVVIPKKIKEVVDPPIKEKEISPQDVDDLSACLRKIKVNKGPLTKQQLAVRNFKIIKTW